MQTCVDRTIELLFRLRDSEGFDKSNGTSYVINLDETRSFRIWHGDVWHGDVWHGDVSVVAF